MMQGNRLFELEQYGPALKFYLKSLSIYVYLQQIDGQYREKQANKNYFTKANGYLNIANCFSKLDYHE